MQNDKTTLKDLSIFTSDGSGGVFALIDRATTQAGREALRRHIQHPPDSAGHLADVQAVVKYWAANAHEWPQEISNGTLVMLEKFFDSADHVASPPTGITLLLSSFLQKLLNRNQFFFTQFSISHLSDFLKGCSRLVKLTECGPLPGLLGRELDILREGLEHRLADEIMAVTRETKYAELARLNYLARREMKNMVHRLMLSYARLDAWRAMAVATTEHGWAFPELAPAQPLVFETAGLYHPLLHTPVPYRVSFSGGQNFLVLTGANMSGKTTFMRATGVAALLAHLGMGVPAAALRISFMQGIITNMHVEDNILRGESYFYAEVQRMKHTAEKLLQDTPHLVLMDELFKGTNVHDAYECTKAVMEGLLHHNRHLMILSTHLYEVAHRFEGNAGIIFSYFETQLAADGSYNFTYQLKHGISNDRIGYRILQQEGIINLLNQKVTGPE